MSIPLFPPYLNSTANDGTRSQGVAVVFLIACLNGWLRGGSLEDYPGGSNLEPLEPSDRYVDAVIERVKFFQKHAFGFEGDSIDGDFGPDTRAAALEKFKLDFGAVPNTIYAPQITTYWVDQHGVVQVWPPKATG
jgi:hypothetical protein